MTVATTPRTGGLRFALPRNLATRVGLFGVLGALLVTVVLLGAGQGAVEVPAREVFGSVMHKLGLDIGAMPTHPRGEDALWNVRFPRVVLAALAGASLASAGALMVGQPGFWPCTPYGCMKMLESIGYDLRGKHAVVIGRSNIVGKPMALMLLQKNATVTICHSATQNLKAITLQADVIVAAVGKEKVLTADMVKPGAVVIDVGMNRNDDGKLCGDVEFAAVREVAGWITPVPGGVGPMTITMLLVNTLEAAERG